MEEKKREFKLFYVPFCCGLLVTSMMMSDFRVFMQN